ncbi:unnamed protein product, partial [Oppiella nova]
QLLDCSSGEDICANGAAFAPIYAYIEKQGMTSLTNYPYLAQKGRCNRQKERQVIAKIGGWKWITTNGDEERLLKAVQSDGPVAVAIHASDAWSRYSRGVFSGPCGGGINHAVLVVGYGYDGQSDRDFWIVKNSWGEGYGDRGYVYMHRNGGNVCSIASHTVQVY